MLEHALIIIAGFLAAITITPLVRSIAIKLDVVDHPDSHRKLHGRVVARAGGTAILLSVLLVCFAAAFRFDWRTLTSTTTYITPYLGLLTAMVGIWLVGLADDIWTLRGRQKLLGQLLMASVLVVTGFQIRNIAFLGFDINLGMLSIPISLLWLLATTNALNLIDGADGLCSTLGAIICGALGILASSNGHFAEAAIAFALCGALLGFLVFNFPPASIFLGDSGSLLVGMVAGALSIRCSLKGPASVAFLAPMAILFLPLLDSAMAIVRRKLTGRSIYTTDRAHLHHTLRNKGLGDRGLLLVVASLAMITAAGALTGQALGRDWIGPISVVVVFALLVVTKAFGHAELVLVARRSTHFLSSLLEPARTIDGITRERSVRLQGTRQWETVWQTLVEFAEREELCKVHMDLNVPWLEEGFHGTWQRIKQPDRLERWTTSLPIHASNRIAGRLDVIGPDNTLPAMSKLLELLEDITPQVEALLLPQGTATQPATLEVVARQELATSE
jgi:UDP-GlcNAc:undecaprenyl-phosphate/decaprenyl-phosphate GlcNAc-1-phosphate transferase